MSYVGDLSFNTRTTGLKVTSKVYQPSLKRKVPKKALRARKIVKKTPQPAATPGVFVAAPLPTHKPAPTRAPPPPPVVAKKPMPPPRAPAKARPSPPAVPLPPAPVARPAPPPPPKESDMIFTTEATEFNKPKTTFDPSLTKIGTAVDLSKSLVTKSVTGDKVLQMATKEPVRESKVSEPGAQVAMEAEKPAVVKKKAVPASTPTATPPPSGSPPSLILTPPELPPSFASPKKGVPKIAIIGGGLLAALILWKMVRSK